jgi:catechol 2,3-dioxygenase-like lactoylglutathione lyase family enzyme
MMATSDQRAETSAAVTGPEIVSLTDVTIGTADPGAWASLGRRLLGAEVVANGRTVSIVFTTGKALEIREGAPGALLRIGWSVRDAGGLSRISERAEALRPELELSPFRLRADDIFPAMTTIDPDGVVVDMGTEGVAADVRAGGPELGHVVMGTADLRRALRFYMDVLGLRISDHVRIPLKSGGATSGTFLRAADRRHHSLALIDTTPGLRHVMVELPDLDAVGTVLDQCDRDGTVTRTIGRHTNDAMVSFYLRGPDGVEIEVGCGGFFVDEDAWELTTHERPSVWGHRFVRDTES